MWHPIILVFEAAECRARLAEIEKEMTEYAASRQDEIDALKQRIEYADSWSLRY